MSHYDGEILKLLEARGPMKTPEIATAIHVPILRANKIMHSLERYRLVKSEHTPNHPPLYGVIIWRLARCSLIRRCGSTCIAYGGFCSITISSPAVKVARSTGAVHKC